MMNKSIVAAIAAVASSACFAESVDGLPDIPVAATNAPIAKPFTMLPLCLRVEGTAQVRLSGGEWQSAEEGKFYPFGASYRAGKDSVLTVAFGPGAFVTVKNGDEFGTRSQVVGEPSRTIILVNGVAAVKLPDNLEEGKFFVTAPGFKVKNPAGESCYTYAKKGDGDEAVVRCVTGSLGIEGRHFNIPSMSAANEVKIRTSHDYLTTILNGTSGDYVVKLDQGIRYREDFDDEGKMTVSIEKAAKDWHLSPFTKIIINRSVPSVGERMSVHTMAFDASGERKSECYFSEGRAEVNSGELVAAEKVSGEDLAKRAAEVTESSAASETTTEAAAEEEKTSASDNAESSEKTESAE